jgi:hypothetical protein
MRPIVVVAVGTVGVLAARTVFISTDVYFRCFITSDSFLPQCLQRLTIITNGYRPENIYTIKNSEYI